MSEAELEEKKRHIVKRICDLKVKLAKLREEIEFEDALKEQTEDGSKCDPSGNGASLLPFSLQFPVIIFGFINEIL